MRIIIRLGQNIYTYLYLLSLNPTLYLGFVLKGPTNVVAFLCFLAFGNCGTQTQSYFEFMSFEF